MLTGSSHVCSPPNVPETVDALVARGHNCCRNGRFDEAREVLQRAVAHDPGHPMALNNLGWAWQMLGRPDEALTCYRRALVLDGRLRIARRNAIALLLALGRRDECFTLWHAEYWCDADGLEWIRRLVSDALDGGRLPQAGEFAAMVAQVRWGRGAALGSAPFVDTVEPEPIHPPSGRLSVPRLLHDIAQFEYLKDSGIFDARINAAIATYRIVADDLERREGPDGRCLIDDHLYEQIGSTYDRLLHVRTTPRVPLALSPQWDRVQVQSDYLDRPPGLVVIDNFLTADALAQLRRFCLESTVWFANRYAHGRLGAFFQDGFNCPLLLQIAEEIRDALPRVIGNRYPLRQIWGFKNAGDLPADATTHADFAAVNVNFWITPNEANLDPDSGGLIVYDVDAPQRWDFDTYNGRLDVIRPFLDRQKARAVRIPYRQNRAIIFNSDLFHGTDAVRFRPEYPHRRINVTMLYGDRERETDHRDLARPEPMAETSTVFQGWRSPVFTRLRR
ncbi:tetratricopeptide repeat protein [Burkholderia sp. LMG 32019]|uniref:tetratricopeptide repeat protein n=1 Tax=Burkholderia sp. LMG 32019 TaxID=3158173 RepID=UPI003C2B8391